MALRQCFPKEQHCITVFGRNGVTSPFLEGTELRQHFWRERHGIGSLFLEGTARNSIALGFTKGMVLHEGVQRELHCLKVYQRNGATWVFTDGTALREPHHVDRLFGRDSSSLKVSIFLL
jgi:hypothetical protein